MFGWLGSDVEPSASFGRLGTLGVLELAVCCVFEEVFFILAAPESCIGGAFKRVESSIKEIFQGVN